MDRKLLGQRIYNLRQRKGLDQDDLEAQSGVSKRLISDLENGRGNPGLNYIEDLETVLGESIITLGERSLLHRLPGKEMKQLIDEPETVSHLTVSSVMARLLNETPQVRAAALSVIYGDPTIARLNTSSDRKGSR